MCTISSNLKLCTCSIADLDNIKHYWTLSRATVNAEVYLGEIIPPPEISEAVHKLNRKNLTLALNQPGCFDTEINPQPGDVLNLYFYCPTPNSYRSVHTVYSFKSRNGRWVSQQHDPFENNQQISQGEIANPLQDLRHLT